MKKTEENFLNFLSNLVLPSNSYPPINPLGLCKHNHHLPRLHPGNHDPVVGGFNPSEKYDRQIGSFPQIGMKIKNV